MESKTHFEMAKEAGLLAKEACDVLDEKSAQIEALKTQLGLKERDAALGRLVRLLPTLIAEGVDIHLSAFGEEDWAVCLRCAIYGDVRAAFEATTPEDVIQEAIKNLKL